MLYRMKCNRGFRDGNLFPRFVRPGEMIEVDEATFLKMRQSDPYAFEYASATRVIPPSTVAVPDASPEKAVGDA